MRQRRGSEDSDSSRSLSPSFHEQKEHRIKEPFFVISLQVGASLLVLCVLGYIFILLKPRHDMQHNFREVRLKPILPMPVEQDGDLDELPQLELFTKPQAWKINAFDIAKEYLVPLEEEAHNNSTNDVKTLHLLARKASETRSAFAVKYGGETAAKYLIQECIKVLTADSGGKLDPSFPWVRVFQRAREQRKMTIAFIGQSTTAGYGNHHKQSFPFVLENLLQPLLKILDIELIVRNHAMEHIGPFPYTWCLNEYIGTDVDIISWDFGPTTPQDLEIWIRAILALDYKPMLIFRDSFAAGGRHKIVQQYVDANLLQAPTIFDWEVAVKPFLQVKAIKRPAGFIDWNIFGVPPGVQALPGQNNKENWTIRQHALVGDVLCIWLLGYVELMVAAQLGTYDIPKPGEIAALHTPLFATASQLKKPYSNLLYFTSPSQLSCYTTFDPVLSGNMNFVASGTVEAPLLDPKGATFYNSGWVLDLEPDERKEKLLTKEWDYLGMKDTQKSFYGLQASGTLAMRLEMSNGPLELLVLCESHSPPKKDACVLGHDIDVEISGEKAPGLTRIDSDAVAFNGKRLCYLVDLPEGIKSKIGDVELEIRVSNALVTWSKGACTLSHIIWKGQHDASTQ